MSEQASPAEGAEYLTADEAAALLRVPRSWVYARTRTGEMPGMRRLGPKYVRISRAALIAWIEAQGNGNGGGKP